MTDHENLDNYINSRLKPAENIRRVETRCCGNCRYHVIISGFFCCRRTNGYGCDAGEGEQWAHVCDRWQKK